MNATAPRPPVRPSKSAAGGGTSPVWTSAAWKPLACCPWRQPSRGARTWYTSFDQSFLTQPGQVLPVELVGCGDVLGVASLPLTSLIAAEQQDCGSPRIEGEQDAKLTGAGGGPRFLDVRNC
jgi:hypothetical protein